MTGCYLQPVRRRLVALALCTCLAALASCGEAGDKLVPVNGRVTVSGNPVPVGSVSFRPDAAKGNEGQHHPTGTVDPDGNYELFTAGRKGAPPGWYKVLIFADQNRLLPDGGGLADPKWMVHVKYIDERTTDLAIEVVEKPAPGQYACKCAPGRFGLKLPK